MTSWDRSMSHLNLRWKAAVVCHVMALTFCAVAAAVGPWMSSAGDGDGHVTLGVWEACLELQCFSILSHEHLKQAIGSWIYWVEVCAVCGVTLISLALLTSVCVLIFTRTKVTVKSIKLTAGTTAVGGIFFLAALLTFTFKVWGKLAPHSDSPLHRGASMNAGWFGFTMTSLAIAFYILHSASLTSPRRDYIPLK